MAVASVSVVGRAEEVQTNWRGRFILSGVPVGKHGLTVRHLGYAPLTHSVTVSRGVTTEVDVGMVPDPVEMEPLVATATRLRRLEVQGFYERKYWGELVSGGTFFTDVDIERRNPTIISHMIADAPGVFLGNCGMRRNNCQLLSSRISNGFSDDGCPLNVYIDGILLGGPNGRPSGRPDYYVNPSRSRASRCIAARRPFRASSPDLIHGAAWSQSGRNSRSPDSPSGDWGEFGLLRM